jgi:hypothetical protein
MAELEALLFRKSRGELFDLPAYREVLFLYALARDLLDRAAVDTGSVDLLLPLNDGTSSAARRRALDSPPGPRAAEDACRPTTARRRRWTGHLGTAAPSPASTASRGCRRRAAQALAAPRWPCCAAALQPRQPFQRLVQRLVLLGEAQARQPCSKPPS